ncbi:hypothetical protein [Allokutzneria oryzae]|uniref:Tyrosine-type recombinase/integrase n=1 Tax=Allokutzneria oryzae TaxID=1378989 RepID=A0ABV5ZRZ3_9PSEU
MIGANPCRKLRIDVGDRPERPHASPDEVDALAVRASPENAVLIITAAYCGMRWGELAGLQWSRINLDAGEITIDPEVGALHEADGRLRLGPPKTPASVRTVYLPGFLVETLTELRHRHPTARFVFTGADGGCIAAPTSAAGSGCHPWPVTRLGVGLPSSRACTRTANGPLTKIVNGPSDQQNILVGDTGIEPVTSTVSTKINNYSDLRK